MKSEIKEAIKTLKNGKTSGVDRLPAEFIKADIEIPTKVVKDITDVIWIEERLPNRWNKGLIFRLPKKENLHYCEN